MPSLGKHDELSVTLACKADIDAARTKNECILKTSKGLLQYGVDCQRRLNAVLQTLNGTTDTVEWKMADNSFVTLDYDSMSYLIAEADALAGPKLLSAFQYAQALKSKLDAKGFVSKRDIASEKWL
ncbi:MAG: hypothetical protein RR740_00170 [Pseudomonas sp.]